MTVSERHVNTIAKHGVGRGLARVIVKAADDNGIPLSVLLGVADVESGFRNVFGHDAVSNPVKSPPGGLLAVTKPRYLRYRKHRDAGEGQQGVGVMQLTDRGLQSRADELGGCWTLTANVRAGAEVLGRLIRKHGPRRGLASYNGGETGWRNGLDYATKVEGRATVWHHRLVG